MKNAKSDIINPALAALHDPIDPTVPGAADEVVRMTFTSRFLGIES